MPSLEQRYTQARETSSALPKRPMGIWLSSLCCTFSGMPDTISVSMKPGATALMVMPLAASSLASDFVMAATPALEAA